MNPALEQWVEDVKAYQSKHSTKANRMSYKQAMMSLSAERKGKKAAGPQKAKRNTKPSAVKDNESNLSQDQVRGLREERDELMAMNMTELKREAKTYDIEVSPNDTKNTIVSKILKHATSNVRYKYYKKGEHNEEKHGIQPLFSINGM